MEDQIDPKWRKATYSGNGGGSCVEVGNTDRAVRVRDTKQAGQGPELDFASDEWRRFIDGLKAE